MLKKPALFLFVCVPVLAFSQKKNRYYAQTEAHYAAWFGQQPFKGPDPFQQLFGHLATGSSDPDLIGFNDKNSQLFNISCYSKLVYAGTNRFVFSYGLGCENISLNLFSTKAYRQQLEYVRDTAMNGSMGSNGIYYGALYLTSIDTHTTWKKYTYNDISLRFKMAFTIVCTFRLNMAAGIPFFSVLSLKKYDDYTANRPHEKTYTARKIKFFRAFLSSFNLSVSNRIFKTQKGEAEIYLGWAQLSLKQPMLQVGLSYSRY